MAQFYEGLKDFYKIQNSKKEEAFIKEFSEHFYYPNACQICSRFNALEPLKSCKNCKLMFYCSDQHEADHRTSEHEDFCNALTNLTGKKRYLFQDCDLSNLRTRINFIGKAQEKVRSRELKLYERNMFMFPRVCFFCNESDPKELKPCSACPFATFCRKHDKKIPFHKHSEDCKRFNDVFYIDRHWVVFKDMPLEYIVHPVPVNEKYIELPEDMNKFIEEFVASHQTKINCHSNSNDAKVCIKLVSTVLTRSLTLIYALHMLNLKFWSGLKVIYIISKGNKFVEENFGEFEILLHWFPKLKNIQVHFIGCKKPSEAVNIHLCPDCKGNQNSLRISFTEMTFKDYYHSTSTRKPDIIVAYNVDYRTHDTWAHASSLFSTLDIPIVLTAMCEPYLNAAAGDCMTDTRNFSRIAENPFKSLKMERFLNHVSFSNKFISIYHKDLSPKICDVDDPIEPCNSCIDCRLRNLEETNLKELMKEEEDTNEALHNKILKLDEKITKLKQHQILQEKNVQDLKSQIVRTYFNLAERVAGVLQDIQFEFAEDII